MCVCCAIVEWGIQTARYSVYRYSIVLKKIFFRWAPLIKILDPPLTSYKKKCPGPRGTSPPPPPPSRRHWRQAKGCATLSALHITEFRGQTIENTDHLLPVVCMNVLDECSFRRLVNAPRTTARAM